MLAPGLAVQSVIKVYPFSTSGQTRIRSFNYLELRAVRLSLRKLAVPGNVVRFYLDNMTARAYIRKMGGTRSSFLRTESLVLWQEAIRSNITILPPHWLSSEEIAEADFLSRHSEKMGLQACQFRVSEGLPKAAGPANPG